MLTTLSGLAPVLAGLFCGWWLRQAGVAREADGRFLLLLNLYVCMPALILRSLTDVELTRDIVVFPAAAVVMVGLGYVAGRVAARGRDRSEATVVVMSLMVVNAAFALPFVDAAYGAAGVARLAAFDAVHSLLVLTVVHLLAARSSPARESESAILAVLRTPPLYATVVGIGLSLAGRELPGAVDDLTAFFASASPMLVAVGAGVMFRPTRRLLGAAGRLGLVRVTLGLVVATAIVLTLGLDGVDAGVLVLLGAAPVGFVVVTFSAKHELDTDLASQALVGSILLSTLVATGFVLW